MSRKNESEREQDCFISQVQGMLLAKANARATMGSCCLLAQTIVVVAPAVQVMQVQVTVGCKQRQAVARKRNGNGRRNLACRQTQ